MSVDKENEVRLQFLEEAQEYLDTIESGVLGISSTQLERQRIDGILRAAHSIKGGAAMMGFNQLSEISHRLEDFFKVIKSGKAGEIDGNLESLFLISVDHLRQVSAFNRQGKQVEEKWLKQHVEPVLERLHQRLGDPQPEDAAAMLAAEIGEDMSVLLFETEIEACLQKLEAILEESGCPNLAQELLETAQLLNGVGEMLELSAFSRLCQAVEENVNRNPDEVENIARVAVATWRRAQALVLVGQANLIPDTLEFEVAIPLEDLSLNNVETDVSLSGFLPSGLQENLQAAELFSSIDDFVARAAENESAPVKATTNEAKKTRPAAAPTILINNQAKEEIVEVSKTDNTIRVAVEQLDKLGELFAEIAIERNGLDLQLKSLRHSIELLGQRVKVLEKSNFLLRVAYDKITAPSSSPSSLSSSPSPSSPSSLEGFDILEMDRYSDIHLLSQEVMETVVQVQEVTKDIEINLDETQRNARELNRSYKSMQTTLNQVRMRPLSDLLGRFPRALRDMSLQYGKQVELKIRGGNTLIDRIVLEALNDPLLHLLRNAFDHGIETAEVRLAQKKSPTGIISITAAYRGNQTVLTISDDGRGINLEKIKTRAKEMGLDNDMVSKASEKELLDLIFEPGFTTAEKVTDLSGRGVGMDVVRTNLERINGTIEVNTKPNVGTTFTIVVPLSLSILRILLVESQGMLMAFPSNSVEEMLPLQTENILVAAGQEVLNWEGYMVPLIRLNKWLRFNRMPQMQDSDSIPTIDQPTVLIIAQGEELVGIQVDKYWREEEVSIRQIEGAIKMPSGFVGCTILGDGQVVPFIDAIALLEWIEYQRESAPVKVGIKASLKQGDSLNFNEAEGTPTYNQPDRFYSLPKQKNMVMVVDDSTNVRRFLAQTLERANYRVEQAKDGQDALEKIQSGLPVEAVICDIEMPRLDGYGFLSQVKANSKNQALPVVMLTSRSGNKHRQLAMNLGAKAYFSKPFQEKDLLQTLQEIMKS